MKLYNALSQKIETFEPYGEAVTVYVCGITPYDTTHLGHAFTYTAFDILIRYLEQQGYPVRYAQNVTDIDDDILRKAKEVGDQWDTLGNRWTAHFIEDMQSLNVRPPDFYPRATDVIDDIIITVQRLLAAGVAYESNGNVYFHIDTWPAYGQLCCLTRDEMLPIANERGNNPDDPHKRDPLDFVLWQAQAPGEPAWESPWGPGRPGWHIECSTMSTRFLGDTIDIHGGGADLLFPHHESEIAQAEPLLDKTAGATGPCFTRFWLHTAMVYHDGEKMSKSLGNLVMARDLQKTWSPDALRLYLGGHHYRQIWSHSNVELEQAGQLAKKLRAALTASNGQGPSLDPIAAQTAFDEAMANDLDTPTALTILERLADDILAANGQNLDNARQTLRHMGHIFGLRLDATKPETRVMTGWNEHLKRFT
jgi:L-cysteine:1D-myo-inositol 2-amino-2-deoxy-alpha-D-glucopyranoside ligase